MPRVHPVGLGGAQASTPAGSGDAGGPHVPGDLIASDVMAGTPGGFPEFAGAADPVIVFPQFLERQSDRRIAAGSRRRVRALVA